MSELPRIAIVGRPNVGKSTLFNRLTGRRQALVSDMPGLTRDRREGKAQIGGHEVIVVDTAGFEDANDGSIPARMRQQSEMAVETADLVLFVIDARDGVMPSDKVFADIVRKAGRPTVLVANKCEGRAGLGGIYEAFELGLGQAIGISAEHGEGLSDLESDVMAALGLQPKAVARRRRRGDGAADDAATDEGSGVGAADDEPVTARSKLPIRVAIVGRPNAGKSTLTNALIGEDRMITGPEPGLTRDAIVSSFTWKGQAFELTDTAGLRRKARVSELAEKLSVTDALKAVRYSEVAILLIDAERPLEHQDLTIGAHLASEGRAIVIAINKWDLVAEKQRALAEIKEMVADRLAQVPGVPIVTISALSETGLTKLMNEVVRVYGLWNRRIPTPQLNRWLTEAMERHAAPASRGRRVKIRYITQPSTRPPTFVAFSSQPGSLPDSYVRYLLNSLRETFDLPGVPIRFNLRKTDNPYSGGKR